MKWNHKAISRARKLREKKEEIRRKLEIEKNFSSKFNELILIGL